MNLVTIEEAATSLKIKRPTVYHYIKKLSLQKYRKRNDRKTYLNDADLLLVQRAMDEASQSTGAVLVVG